MARIVGWDSFQERLLLKQRNERFRDPAPANAKYDTPVSRSFRVKMLAVMPQRQSPDAAFYVTMRHDSLSPIAINRNVAAGTSTTQTGGPKLGETETSASDWLARCSTRTAAEAKPKEDVQTTWRNSFIPA